MLLLQAPLYIRVLIGVICGTALGFGFQQREILFGYTNADLSQLAGLYVQLLTALATPLIFFAIVDAFVRTNISGRQGLKMFLICLFNIAVAFTIGLTILNLFQPGLAWNNHFQQQAASLNSTPEGDVQSGKLSPASHRPESDTPTPSGQLASPLEPAQGVSLSPIDFLQTNIPKNIVQPFSENKVLTIALLAILVGTALRSLKKEDVPDLRAPLVSFDHVITVSFQVVLKLLLWLIELCPIAIGFAVAGVVAGSGWGTFQMVGVFIATVITGLAIHSLIYYPLSIWLFTGRSPLSIFRNGGSAILTGLSLNSSLATAPLTLEALKKMRVNESAARLSACVGTNFNNDGVTLYEAMTALFITQAMGVSMGYDQQVIILLAALVGSMGIAGIPNSGLIILALVLKAAKLPDTAIQIAIPLVYSFDFIIARLRSAVNVMGDLQVAILLDAGEPREIPDTPQQSTDEACQPTNAR